MHATNPVSMIERHSVFSVTLICGWFFVRIISDIQCRDPMICGRDQCRFNFNQKERRLDSEYSLMAGCRERRNKSSDRVTFK